MLGITDLADSGSRSMMNDGYHRRGIQWVSYRRCILSELCILFNDFFSHRLRLDITPPPQKKTPKKQKQKAPERSQKRGTKRRRVEDTRSTVHSATATGVVAIEDSDPEGEYIKLHNTSESVSPAFFQSGKFSIFRDNQNVLKWREFKHHFEIHPQFFWILRRANLLSSS